MNLYIFKITEKHAWDLLNGSGSKLQEELIVQDENNKHICYNAGKFVLLPQMNLPKAHIQQWAVYTLTWL